jgi:hypothetical protein
MMVISGFPTVIVAHVACRRFNPAAEALIDVSASQCSDILACLSCRRFHLKIATSVIGSKQQQLLLLLLSHTASLVLSSADVIWRNL